MAIFVHLESQLERWHTYTHIDIHIAVNNQAIEILTCNSRHHSKQNYVND